MSFCFFTIDSAMPSNLYFKSMCASPEFRKSTSMSSKNMNILYITLKHVI